MNISTKCCCTITYTNPINCMFYLSIPKCKCMSNKKSPTSWIKLLIQMYHLMPKYIYILNVMMTRLTECIVKESLIAKVLVLELKDATNKMIQINQLSVYVCICNAHKVSFVYDT